MSRRLNETSTPGDSPRCAYATARHCPTVARSQVRIRRTQSKPSTNAESANQHTLTGDLACSYLVRNGFLSLSKQVSTFSHINKGCSMRDDGYWDEANTKCKHNKTCTDWKHARMLTACWGLSVCFSCPPEATPGRVLSQVCYGGSTMCSQRLEDL